MNRIYQGRVTKVEKFKAGKKGKSPEDWEPLENWQTVLWRHHELFQDAVNYYTLALAAMGEGQVDAKGESTPMAKFAEQVRGNSNKKIEGRWEDFIHKGTRRHGLKQSLSRTLNIPLKEITWEKCDERILGNALKKFPKRKDNQDHDVFHGVMAELFPEQSRGMRPKTMSNTDWPWLCWKDATGETPAKSTYRKRHGINNFMVEFFQANDGALKKIAERQVEETYLTSVEQNDEMKDGQSDSSFEQHDDDQSEDNEDANESNENGFFVGEEALKIVKECLQTARLLISENTFKTDFESLEGDIPTAQNEFTRIEEAINKSEDQIKENSNSLKIQKWKKGGKGKDNKRVELFALFTFDKGSEFTTMLLKARLKQKYLQYLHKNDLKAYVEFVEKYKLRGSGEGKEPAEKVIKAEEKAQRQVDEPSAIVNKYSGSNDFIKIIRDKVGYVFPSFTAICGFVADPENDQPKRCRLGETAWKNFEFAAYEEAIKAPHQIKQKTDERMKELKKLEGQKKAFEGKGREKSDDDIDDGHIPGGFKDGGDPRFQAIRRIHKDLAVEDGVEEGRFYEYGISQAALRGYEELREAWNKKVKPDEAYNDQKAKELKKLLTNHQKKHREDVGAVRLFEEFLKRENRCLWQAPTERQEQERVSKNYSTNIVRDYLRYVEVLEEIEKKSRPVQYTPADASESRRLFDLKAAAQGGFEHLSSNKDGLSFTTQIIMKDEKDLLFKQEVRIHYTAPRLLRDESRILSNDEKLKSANWVQPMMRAFGIPESITHDFSNHAVSLMPDWKKGSRSDMPDRLLLNFVLTPKEEPIIKHLRKEMKREQWPWFMQFNWNGDGHDSILRWPHEDWAKVKDKKGFPGKWFENKELKSFRCLSVDLGQKQAGAYALIEVNCSLPESERDNARYIGTTGTGNAHKDWYARVLTTGLFKLPGEDVKVFRYATKEDQRLATARGEPIPEGKAFREELSGSAGRKATLFECNRTIELLEELHQLDLLDDDARKASALQERFSFPEQNEKLLVALRRAQSFAGRLHRWCWYLSSIQQRNDNGERPKTAIKEIAESDAHPWLKADIHDFAKKLHAQIKDKDASLNLDPRIEGTLRLKLKELTGQLPEWLLTIANRVYPSRRGCFVWVKHPGKKDCYLLDFHLWKREDRVQRTDADEGKLLAGQYGISIKRIEQFEELRKRCQSLNQMFRREIGDAPPRTRDDSIPDPCPALLTKLDNMKEHRRNQTAHMILAEALGLKLAKPNEPVDEVEKKLREVKDSHGEYVKVDSKGREVAGENSNAWRGVVDFIVIEDLSRYLTSQGRAPHENSRLMKWCHRAVRDKLKEMCTPFGIPLLETPAAYSSRFCSRTGVAGFRATELSPAMLFESKWQWKVHKRNDGKETKDQRESREWWERVYQNLMEINKGCNGISKGNEYRTLLVPEAGGNIFVPIAKINERYIRPDKDPNKPKLFRPVIQYFSVLLEDEKQRYPRFIHADINAAVNLGLRAIADPCLWSIHPRLRSERELGSSGNVDKKGQGSKKGANQNTEIRPDQFFVREKRKYGVREVKNRIEILTDGEKLKASESRHPNFFADFANISEINWGKAELKGLSEGDRKPIHLVSGKALWNYVREQQWKRIEEINSRRVEAWKKKAAEAATKP